MIHPEVVVKLAGIAGHRGDFLETEVIRVWLFKRKNHVDKILSQLRDVGYALMRIGDADHGFGGVQGNRADVLEFADEMVKQH